MGSRVPLRGQTLAWRAHSAQSTRPKANGKSAGGGEPWRVRSTQTWTARQQRKEKGARSVHVPRQVHHDPTPSLKSNLKPNPKSSPTPSPTSREFARLRCTAHWHLAHNAQRRYGVPQHNTHPECPRVTVRSLAEQTAPSSRVEPTGARSCRVAETPPSVLLLCLAQVGEEAGWAGVSRMGASPWRARSSRRRTTRSPPLT